MKHISHLTAAFKNDVQPSSRIFAAPRASDSCCISSSSARSKCCGTDIRGNLWYICLIRSEIESQSLCKMKPNYYYGSTYIIKVTGACGQIKCFPHHELLMS